jgi:hypothetical protein
MRVGLLDTVCQDQDQKSACHFIGRFCLSSDFMQEKKIAFALWHLLDKARH